MTKPMYCPISFANSSLVRQKLSTELGFTEIVGVEHFPTECTPDCAWAKNNGQAYWCGMVPTDTKAALANVNTRPLKDDE